MKRKSYNEYKPRERKEKLEKLRANLDIQQTIFKKKTMIQKRTLKLVTLLVTYL